MNLTIVFLIGIVAFIIGSIFLSLIEARFDYQISFPEIAAIRNGIKWLRDHNQKKLYRSNVFVLYLFFVFVNFSFLSRFHFLDIEDYLFVCMTILMIPLFIFPFIHDLVYSKEYNRLENMCYETRILDELPKKRARDHSFILRIPLLVLGIVLFIFQSLILFI